MQEIQTLFRLKKEWCTLDVLLTGVVIAKRVDFEPVR